jgi:dienelactone hydrolase
MDPRFTPCVDLGRTGRVGRRLAPLLALLASGCVAYAPLSEQYAGPRQLPTTLATATAQDAVPLEARAAERARNRVGFTVRELELPPVEPGHGPIPYEYYDVDGAQRTPVIVLLPIFNGQPIVTRYFARYFADRGWAAVMVLRDREVLENLERPEQAIRGNLLEYRRVLDWIEQQPDLDPGRIGLFGISLGAMDAVMLTALDDRVDALVAAMAGGDLPYLLFNTNYRPVIRTMEDMVEDSGLTRDELQERLGARIATDPLKLAPYVDAHRVLMILTRTDAIVPFEAQQALRESMGAPESLILPTGHRTSIVYFPLLRSSAYDFFTRQFEASAAPVARR